MFEKALAVEDVKASLCTEYAMFLVKYHNNSNIEEYEKIKQLLQKAIKLGNDDSGLSYGKAVKLTIVKPLQELLEKQNEILIQPYILAHYLLITVHAMHTNKVEGEEAFNEFKSITISLEEMDEHKLAQYLLDYTFKELADQKNYLERSEEINLSKAAIVIQKSWRKHIESERTKKQTSQAVSL